MAGGGLNQQLLYFSRVLDVSTRDGMSRLVCRNFLASFDFVSVFSFLLKMRAHAL